MIPKQVYDQLYGAGRAALHKLPTIHVWSLRVPLVEWAKIFESGEKTFAQIATEPTTVEVEVTTWEERTFSPFVLFGVSLDVIASPEAERYICDAASLHCVFNNRHDLCGPLMLHTQSMKTDGGVVVPEGTSIRVSISSCGSFEGVLDDLHGQDILVRYRMFGFEMTAEIFEEVRMIAWKQKEAETAIEMTPRVRMLT